MPKGKPYSGSINSQTARQLLNSSGEVFHGVPLGDALADTAGRLVELVEQCNKFLGDNEFAKMVADYHAIKLGRRGKADLVVTAVGQVVLEIGYDEAPTQMLVKSTRRKLPLLKVLRAEADALGVSIEHLGIKRKEICEYLERVRAERKGSRRLAAVEDDPGPMSAGPDETKVLPPSEDPPRPKRARGFVKTGDAVEGPSFIVDEASSEQAPASRPEHSSVPRPSMRQMVEQSKEVNIADLLDSKAPE